jgi:hypothetical protein
MPMSTTGHILLSIEVAEITADRLTAALHTARVSAAMFDHDIIGLLERLPR